MKISVFSQSSSIKIDNIPMQSEKTDNLYNNFRNI